MARTLGCRARKAYPTNVPTRPSMTFNLSAQVGHHRGGLRVLLHVSPHQQKIPERGRLSFPGIDDHRVPGHAGQADSGRPENNSSPDLVSQCLHHRSHGVLELQRCLDQLPDGGKDQLPHQKSRGARTLICYRLRLVIVG